MRLEQKLRTYGGVPLTHGTLLSILEEYRSPNDKIARMINDGWLQPIRKGLYAVSPELKRGKVYDLKVGRFSYTHSQLQLYSIGINRVENSDQTGFLMASPEKALCDKLIFTRNLNVRSQQALNELLFDDLRIDEDALAHFNPEVIRACIAVNVKADMLQALLTLINGLQREAS